VAGTIMRTLTYTAGLGCMAACVGLAIVAGFQASPPDSLYWAICALSPTGLVLCLWSAFL
jgi:hypothetical protein